MTLRAADIDDSDLLLAWRNDPLTVAMSLSPDPVTPEDHDIWLTRVLAADAYRLLVAEDGGTPVGSVRLDGFGGNQFEVSITVSPSHRQRGYGRAMLEAVNRNAFGDLGARRLVAIVKDDNMASRKIFEAAGYCLDSIRNGVCRYQNDGQATGQ